MLGVHKALVWCCLPWEQLLLLICLDKTSFTAREGVGRENLQNSSASDQSLLTELNKDLHPCQHQPSLLWVQWLHRLSTKCSQCVVFLPWV